MPNITAKAGSAAVSYTLLSGATITFPASVTSTQYCTTGDLVDLQRRGLLDMAIASGTLSAVNVMYDDGPSLAAAPFDFFSAGHVLLNRQIFTATGTYTPTKGTNRVWVRMCGGGGGGGGVVSAASNQCTVGAGGASGAYFEKFIDPGAGNYPITGGAATVGAAGAAGANTGANGGNGGDTSIVIGGVTYTAKGGPGGAFTGTSAGPLQAQGGGFVTGTSAGDVQMGQEPGGPGQIFSATVATSGWGGSSEFGAGGAHSISTGAGNPGQGPGGAGSGGVSINTSAAAAGGAGVAGVIIVYEYS